MQGGLGIFVFHEEMLDGTEEFVGFLGKASREEEAKDGRIVEAKIDLFAVWKLDHEELAEMGAEVLDRFVAGEEDTPVLGPGLLDQGVDEGRLGRDANEVGSEVGELRALGDRSKRDWSILLGFVNNFRGQMVRKRRRAMRRVAGIRG